jgi:hypothetical protein
MGNVPADKKCGGTNSVSETAPSGQSHKLNRLELSSLTHSTAATSAQPNSRQSSGLPEPRYGSPSPMNMGNMSYALPGHQSQYDQIQYPAGQNMMYPMPMPYVPYANQPMHNIPQHPPYPHGYYPYGHYPLPRGQMHSGSPVGRTQSNLPPKPDFPKEAEKRFTQLEYDVSKTIVDGSNPMKLVPTQPLSFGECVKPLTGTTC